jgi:hypothetical protein
MFICVINGASFLLFWNLLLKSKDEDFLSKSVSWLAC